MLNKKNTILFTLFAVNLIDQPAPIVKVEQGLLSGKISSDGTIYEYSGIPYATTKGRFQAPLPAPSWNGVYKAVLSHFQCPQSMGISSFGTEDCLKVNIYTPSQITDPLPVMVYIHGGAFMVGSGSRVMQGPELLVKHNVILVTFNYRLGALGFLCLGIKEAPGNAGLKDQIAALKWVKKNIAAFGGDPDNITIFGHSAGAISTSLLVVSDATHGLFNKAIVQSGTSLGFMSSLDGVKIASSVAKHLGYDSNEPKELYDFLSKVAVNDLVSYTSPSSESLLQVVKQNLMFSPCVEKRFPDIEAVYTELPYDLITRKPKNVSIIYGFTDREGFYLVSLETEETLKGFNKKIYDFTDFEFTTENEATTVADKVKQFYFGNEDVSSKTRKQLELMYGDIYFDVPTIIESELMVNKINAPIYNYYFKYSGGRNMVKTVFGKSNYNEPGASHGDDILYIFTSSIWPFRINERDQKIIDWMTKMWTNFAKYGDPTPSSDIELPIKWKPSTKQGLNFLNIDESLQMGPTPNPRRYELWKDLYRRYRKK